MSDGIGAIEGAAPWMEANIDGARGPFTFEMIAGGHSNLTYRVTGANGARYVVRRPPLGHLLQSAHDMGREHRVISALARTAVPVAPALGYCDDPSVIGAPFYVMAFVDGLVVRTEDEAEQLSPVARRRASESLVETMAAIHAVDLTSSGLDTLARHDGYIERQLKRWYGQWNAQKTAELPTVDRVYEQLNTRIPEQGPATIVHGDYRLDNCMIDPNGDVVAVLDWEICTLGDPLADVGLLMAYWAGPTDPRPSWITGATTVEGFLDKADLAARYFEITGRDSSHLPFYVAFAHWKLACVYEGVFARYLGGALGERDPAEIARFREQVEAAAALAEQILEEMA